MNNNQGNQPFAQDPMEYPYWYNKAGQISIWDDPSVVGGIALPNPYQPLTHLGSVLNKFSNGFFEELDVVLLKIVGDAIAANEDQLKRYLESKMTRTQVSKRLKRLRQHGFVDRWQIDSSNFTTEKPPAPFTLGLSGFILLKHLYYSQFFMEPQRWQRLGLSNIQRYVAVNEIRTQLYENRRMRNWTWNGVILNNPYLYQPFGVAEIEGPKGNFNLVIERVQQSKDYMGYLQARFEKWEQVFEEYKTLPIRGFNQNPTVVIIYVSSLSLAEHIHKEMVLEQKKFPVWICVEEDLLEERIGKSFYVPTESKLKLIDIDFLA